jgi:hypothetical protein
VLKEGVNKVPQNAPPAEKSKRKICIKIFFILKEKI